VDLAVQAGVPRDETRAAREQVAREVVCRALAVRGTGSPARQGRGVLAAAPDLVVRAVQSPATAVRAVAIEPAVPVAAPPAALRAPAIAVRAPATGDQLREAPIVARTAVFRMLAANTALAAALLSRDRVGRLTQVVLGIGVALRLRGAPAKAAGHRRSGTRRRGMVDAACPTVDGTAQVLDATVRRARGETGLEIAEKRSRKRYPILDLSQAQSGEQPQPDATSGRGRPAPRAQIRGAARKAGSRAGPTGLPPQAAISGEALAVRASRLAAAGERRNPPRGVARRRFGALLEATRSRVARRSASCLRLKVDRCTRSG